MHSLPFMRSGRGEPLVLIHGIGSSRQVWDPVLPFLEKRFDVIAVDLPGFGESPALPSATEPTPAVLASAVSELLDDLGLDRPHVAGNSLGGWVALELAKTRSLASVAALSPAGLWERGTPPYCRISLSLTRWLACHLGRFLARAVGWWLGRVVVLGQVHGRPGRITPTQARAELAAMASSTGFEATLQATGPRRFEGGGGITAPVTVAFGTRDRLLLRKRWRGLGELPANTEFADLGRCGHVPMPDDPIVVSDLILRATERAADHAHHVEGDARSA